MLEITDKKKRMAKAEEIWAGMNDSERHGVRFGLFPYHVMMAAEAEGYKRLSVELMAVAEKNGGMIA